MAGNIRIDEHLIDNPGPGASILHEYGPRVKVGLGALPAMTMRTAINIVEAPEYLTEAERLGRNAFDLRQSSEYRHAKQNRPYQSRSWGEHGADGPLPLMGPAPLPPEAGPAGAPFPSLSDRMAGRVAVALVMVSGPTPELAFTDDEREKVVADVQEALTWLAAQSPVADITWTYDVHTPTINVPDNATGNDYEPLEAHWRDPALTALGYGTGQAGVFALANAAKTNLGADRAFCALFTKYQLHHFAYADLGGPRLVMSYFNDGWGPDNIDRVFAHETCHIFGAPDEYARSNCMIGGHYGAYGWPNDNCQNGAANGGVDCIMRGNDWKMCDYTRHHVGYTGLSAPAV